MCRRPSLMNHSCAGSDHQHGSTEAISCALCGARAALYCHADSAFLCRTCDKSVHGANILALRHVRCVVCRNCQRLTARYVVGASTEVGPPALARAVRRLAAISSRRSGYEGDRYELSLGIGSMNKSPISSCSSSS